MNDEYINYIKEKLVEYNSSNLSTDEDILNYIFSNQTPKFIKDYIKSQLKVKNHINNLFEGIDFKGAPKELLVNIFENDSEKWINRIREYSLKMSMHKLHLLHQDENDPYLSSSINIKIARTEYIIPMQIQKLEKELSNTPKTSIFKRKTILKSIKSLIIEKEELTKIIHKIPEKDKIGNKRTQEVINEKQKEWDNILNFAISKMHENLDVDGLTDEKIVDNVDYYLGCKESIINVDYIHRLCLDINLNMELLSKSFLCNIESKSFMEVIETLRNPFETQGFLSEDRIEKTNDIRTENLFGGALNPFFRATSKVQDINNDLKNLSLKFEELKKIDDIQKYIKNSIEIFQEFIRIHPYYDGNGRTSRQLLNTLLLNKGILPPILYETYYDRFTLDNLSTKYILEGDKEPLENYIFDLIKKQHFVIQNNQSNIDNQNMENKQL